MSGEEQRMSSAQFAMRISIVMPLLLPPSSERPQLMLLLLLLLSKLSLLLLPPPPPLPRARSAAETCCCHATKAAETTGRGAHLHGAGRGIGTARTTEGACGGVGARCVGKSGDIAVLDGDREGLYWTGASSEREGALVTRTGLERPIIGRQNNAIYLKE
jgi:hypothetical protein